MTAKLDYQWHLRELMATRGMFSTTDLRPLLAERGISLSASQVFRLVTEKPERLSMKTLMALLDILGCRMDELIEPVRATGQQRKAASGETTATAAAEVPEPGVGSFRPKRARIL
ncbi:helix-turn-helix transcriptional regulator [Streptomyces sp. TRM68367]|uniref:helix-turn-helix domain-containing protein n=1 Tax=Streptomyces sp. TRM68367 TaxID=2758415 RepID=UPI00165C884C|nr:helix-turn-helix transcriptional regulator [Streptomyces sp. TRM68367]MBC9730985.1 helix-turn-helix transcriptional regulator [Streptomyces sp. TRM68367]